MQGENLILDAGASYAGFWKSVKPSSAINPTFVYDAPGTYTVSLQTEVTELALTQVNITTPSAEAGDRTLKSSSLVPPTPTLS